MKGLPQPLLETVTLHCYRNCRRKQLESVNIPNSSPSNRQHLDINRKTPRPSLNSSATRSGRTLDTQHRNAKSADKSQAVTGMLRWLLPPQTKLPKDTQCRC